MKQGPGSSRVGDTKREPIVHAINPGAVSEIGCVVVKNPDQMSAGRGFTAPEPKSTTTHHCGSQGKHR